jgi:epsilon-lactone hydrolase
MARMLRSSALVAVMLAVGSPFAATAADGAPSKDAAPPATGMIEADGTVVVPSFRLPPSIYLSDQAKALLPRAPTDMLSVLRAPPQQLVAMRDRMPEAVAPRLAELKRTYGVATRDGTLAGLPATWARPATGVAAGRSRKLLLNFPGGGFSIANAGGMGMLESIPLAGIMGVEIVSITYRQAPEARYPAATEDAVKAYKEILKTHKPEDVVIFGCSAGGILTAQTVAALVREKLPVPAAIGIFCASADMRLSGDSAAFSAPFRAVPGRRNDNAYFAGADLAAPAISPIMAPEILARFPPTLLITGGRSFDVSSAMATNIALEKAEAISQINIWDGLDHGFFLDPGMPESREAFEVMARFFGRHLGLSPR